MTDSFTAELRDLIDRAFTDDLGGMATLNMLQERVWADLPEHLSHFLISRGLRSQVAAYFREQDADGLPKRPAANAEGEHKQLSFFTVEEFAYVHHGYIERAAANEAQAEKVRLRCIETHGVDVAALAAPA